MLLRTKTSEYHLLFGLCCFLCKIFWFLSLQIRISHNTAMKFNPKFTFEICFKLSVFVHFFTQMFFLDNLLFIYELIALKAQKRLSHFLSPCERKKEKKPRKVDTEEARTLCQKHYTTSTLSYFFCNIVRTSGSCEHFLLPFTFSQEKGITVAKVREKGT